MDLGGLGLAGHGLADLGSPDLNLVGFSCIRISWALLGSCGRYSA